LLLAKKVRTDLRAAFRLEVTPFVLRVPK